MKIVIRKIHGGLLHYRKYYNGRYLCGILTDISDSKNKQNSRVCNKCHKNYFIKERL
jgi:hypothetical protein